MFTSEAIINNLLREVDTLTYRLKNIGKAFSKTNHRSLRERLITEKNFIYYRVKEIYSAAKLLEKRNKEKISFSSLLVEKCRRTISEAKTERNLFFL